MFLHSRECLHSSASTRELSITETHWSDHRHRTKKHPDSVLIILRDFNKANLSRELPKCRQHITCPTRDSNILDIYIYWIYIQWGKKVFSQPPIVQVLPLKKMREACNFHHRFTSTMRDKIRKKIQKITFVGFFKNLFANYGGKISIWSSTNKQDCWLSQTCNFFFKRLLCPPLVTCINGICWNSLSV